jgi:hypothetical protein
VHASNVTREPDGNFFEQKGSMSEEGEETPREHQGTKLRRHDGEVAAPGSVPLAEESLSLRRNLDSLFGTIATIGAGGRSAAREHISGHLLDLIDGLIALAMQRKDRVTAQWAARALSVLVYRCINPLIVIAEGKQDTIGKRLAGGSLALIDDALEKHGDRLEKVNSAFRETEAKIRKLKRRRDIVADPGVIGQVVQKELALAELYWERLRFYRRLFGDGWESEVSTQIPREYWASEPLLAFSEKSKLAWWKFLWPLIKKNNADFLVGVRQGKYPTLGIRRDARWSSYRKEFRRHLRAIAKARRKVGVL